MNNYYKVIVVLGIVMIAGVSSWLYFGAYKNIQSKYLEERKINTAAYVRSRVSQFVSLDNFGVADTNKQDQVFKSLFENIQSSENFRIKVYNSKYKIIWSNLKEAIGEDGSNNDELKEALGEGKVALELKKKKEEHFTERRYSNFTEIYVPISDEKGERVGVIEIYQTYAALGEKINKELINTAMKDIAGAIIAFVVLALIVRRLMPRQVN